MIIMVTIIINNNSMVVSTNPFMSKYILSTIDTYTEKPTTIYSCTIWYFYSIYNFMDSFMDHCISDGL